MRSYPADTDRLARGLALLLGAAAVVSLLFALHFWAQARNDRAAETVRVPGLLTSSSAPSSSPPSSGSRPSTSASSPPVRTVVAPIVPHYLFIPAIGVNTSVAAKPTQRAQDPFLRHSVPSFGVPDNLYTTTWWSSGPKPGGDGMAIVLGHTQVHGYGVFNRLGQLHHGEVIGLSGGGTALRFEVLATRDRISKRSPYALRDTLRAAPAGARLALLTCSGSFNGAFRASSENTVVFARLVARGKS